MCESVSITLPDIVLFRMVVWVMGQASFNLLSEDIDLQTIHNGKLFEKYCKGFVGLVSLLGDNSNSAVGTFDKRLQKF